MKKTFELNEQQLVHAKKIAELQESIKSQFKEMSEHVQTLMNDKDFPEELYVGGVYVLAALKIEDENKTQGLNHVFAGVGTPSALVHNIQHALRDSKMLHGAVRAAEKIACVRDGAFSLASKMGVQIPVFNQYFDRSLEEIEKIKNTSITNPLIVALDMVLNEAADDMLKEKQPR